MAKRLWVTIGLNHDTGNVVIAGVSDSPRAAKRKAIERQNNSEALYDAHRTFELTSHTAPAVDAWLSHEHDIERETRQEIVRQIGSELLLMLKPAEQPQ